MESKSRVDWHARRKDKIKVNGIPDCGDQKVCSRWLVGVPDLINGIK